jgi:DNA primase large subunit
MHSSKWKLTNRDLQQGYLTITEEELKRIMEEAAREKILKGLPLPVDEETCTALQEYLGPLKEQLAVIRARDRVDLAHSARFALVSFLLQINMTAVEIVSLFNTSPDFDEERTRYQVEHIAGASGTSYKPPACATMATYGNCPGEDELCRKIRHPLSYYERRMRFFKPLPPERVQKQGT